MTVTVRERGSLWSYRGLLWNFAQRDLKARFKGTALGWAWSLVVPLATLLIYSLVFSTIFRIPPPDFGNGRQGNFTVWLLAGLVPWGMFATSLNTALGSLLATGPLLKKIYFPAYTPVFGSVVSVLIQSGIELGILLVVLALWGNVSWTWLLLPIWWTFFAVFVASVSLALSVLNVYFRDLSHLISVAIQLLFYLTPILYQLSIIPTTGRGPLGRALIEANPLTHFVGVFRDLTYGLAVGDASAWLVVIASTGASAALAIWVYRVRGLDLSEEL